MKSLKKAFYLLFVMLFVGHVLDYVSTYYVVNKMDFSWEKNKYIKNNEDLYFITMMGIFHSFSLLGLYMVADDLVFKKIVRFLQVIILLAYVVPAVTLWNAVIINIKNCFLVAGL